MEEKEEQENKSSTKMKNEVLEDFVHFEFLVSATS